MKFKGGLDENAETMELNNVNLGKTLMNVGFGGRKKSLAL